MLHLQMFFFNDLNFPNCTFTALKTRIDTNVEEDSPTFFLKI